MTPHPPRLPGLPDLPDLTEAFSTERLHLRCPRPGDGAELFQAVTETLPQLRQWPASLPWALHEPSAEASESFCRAGHAAFHAREEFPLLMYLKTGGTLVGAIGLHDVAWDVPEAEMGYWCRSAFQGRGLVSEAAQGLTQWAFSALGARRVFSRTDAQNTPSRRVLERAGLQLEGVLARDRVWPDGSLRDTCIYGITRSKLR
ncbi:MAG: N-acetyltransferase [Comamonadaceae bacterium]|nr:MAG: N-acetyltransferase [Comamonadaceae bacterium]